MAVISKLTHNGKDITKLNNSTLSEINIDKDIGVLPAGSYHFAKSNEVTNGVCENSVNEPIIDMNIQGDSIQRLLPSEYQEVEYLENSGTQRIDTKLVPTASTSIDITYQALEIKNSQYILGSRIDQSARVDYAFNGSSSSTYWDIRLNGVARVMSGASRTTHKYRSNVQISSGNGTWTLTDLDTSKEYNLTLTGNTVSASANLFLFAYNKYDGNTHANLRIFACKIYESGVLIRNYVPCYRKNDNVAGLYDLVTNEFYTNVGTGEFVVGADIESVPSPEQPIEFKSVGDYEETTGKYKIPVNIYGGNLVNENTIQENKLIGNSANGIINDSTSYNTLYMEVEENKTYIFKNFVRANGTTLRGCFYDSNGNWVSAFEETTITIPSGVKYVGRSFSKEVGDVQVCLRISTTNIYLNEPLRKLGEYADILDYKKKKVIRKVWGERPTYYDQSYFGKSFAVLTTYQVFNSNTTKRYVKCNYMQGTNAQPTASERAGKVFIGSATNYVGFGSTTTFPVVGDNATANERKVFQNWLESNNVLIYYVLATQIEETVDLPQLETFDGTTIFEIDTEIKPTENKIKYWK